MFFQNICVKKCLMIKLVQISWTTGMQIVERQSNVKMPTMMPLTKKKRSYDHLFHKYGHNINYEYIISSNFWYFHPHQSYINGTFIGYGNDHYLIVFPMLLTLQSLPTTITSPTKLFMVWQWGQWKVWPKTTPNSAHSKPTKEPKKQLWYLWN